MQWTKINKILKHICSQYKTNKGHVNHEKYSLTYTAKSALFVQKINNLFGQVSK